MTQTERRKLWAFRLSPGNWITIIIFVSGMALAGLNGYVSYAKAMDKIEVNTQGRKDDKKEYTKQIASVEKRLSIKIDSSEGRMRGDMKEIRSGIQQILLKGNHN